MELVLNSNNEGTPTMTSLQLVEFINHLRKQEGNGTYTELRHDDFMRKINNVLKAAPINYGTVFYEVNQGAKRERKIAIFEKREAMLMAMSYSYDIQAVVYDAWETAEKALKQSLSITLPNFMNPAEAAKAWAVEYEQKVENAKQLAIATKKIEDAAPKVQFYDTVVDSSKLYTLLEASKILGVGHHKLMQYLRLKGYLSQKNLPYERYTVNGSGLFSVKVGSPFRNYSTGEVHVSQTTLATVKGVAYLQQKIQGEPL